jgi:hypothetical protein
MPTLAAKLPYLRKLLTSFCAFGLCTVTAANSQDGLSRIEDDGPSSSPKILFIGSSLLVANAMPAAFAHVLRLCGYSKLKIYMSAFGSYALSQHSHNPETLKALLQEGPWDYVILQERSTYPIVNQFAMEKACVFLGEKIRSVHAHAVLLETWKDKNWTEGYDGVVAATYRRIAKEVGATDVPVGDAWSQISAKSNELFMVDGHHPSNEGSYLLVCELVKTLLNKDPRTLPADAGRTLNLSESSARKIETTVMTAPPFNFKHMPGGYGPTGLRETKMAIPGRILPASMPRTIPRSSDSRTSNSSSQH